MSSSHKRSVATVTSTAKGVHGQVSESGRLSLPAAVRREVGLERGGPVRIDVVDGSIRIRTVTEIKDRIRALARSTGFAEKASVDDFVAWRAAERTDEEKKASER
mgnify:CR=1 FL=1